MDRETLFSHLNRRYCSKREMHSRIPLGVQPDALWQELLNSRRAKSTALPLYTPNGSPYWYVTTDRMIAASEKIVETLYTDGADFDPFTEPPPVVTLEESFFTSYIEGAQITMQAAMDFLSSGGPPRDIEEQMITNNRMAGRFAAENLFRGIDEEFLRGLAYILTDGMDNGGQEYRTTDDVDFVTADGDRLIFPDARFVPDRIGELCAYLASPQSHPLIKAGVAQGYMQILRPFPEGNDRIGRILSNIILLRAGYTFFSDVSLSALIARKSYAYYEAAAGILREENGGDMTYFLEFFLELLSRAVDERALRQRRKEEQNLQTEQDMARTALTVPSEPPPVSFRDESERTTEEPEQPIPAVEEAIEKEGGMLDGFFTVPAQEPADLQNKGAEYVGTNSIEQARQILIVCSESNGEKIKACARLLLDFMDQGKHSFTQTDLMNGCGLQQKQASNIIVQLRAKGIIESSGTRDGKQTLYQFKTTSLPITVDYEPGSGKDAEYRDLLNGFFTVPAREPESTVKEKSKKQIRKLLVECKKSSGENTRVCAKRFLEFLDQEKYIFSQTDIAKCCNLNSKQITKVMYHMRKKGIVKSSNVREGRYILYRFNMDLRSLPKSEDGFAPEYPNVGSDTAISQLSDPVPALTIHDYAPDVIEAIKELRDSGHYKKDCRLGEIIFSCLYKGVVTAQDYADYGSIKKMNDDFALPVRMGIVEKVRSGVFRIKQQRDCGLPPIGYLQKAVLSAFYRCFRQEWFTKKMALAELKMSRSRVGEALHQFAVLRLVEHKGNGVYHYRLLVNPVDFPSLFNKDALVIDDSSAIADQVGKLTVPEPLKRDGSYSDEVYDLLEKMAYSSGSMKDRRLSAALQQCLEQGVLLRSDYVNWGLSDSVWKADTEFAVQLGLVRKENKDEYVLNRSLSPMSSQLKKQQKKTITAIYEAFGDQIFSSEMFVATLNYTKSYSYASLHKLALMRVLDQQTTKDGSRYQLLVNPEDNPECFDAAA